MIVSYKAKSPSTKGASLNAFETLSLSLLYQKRRIDKMYDDEMGKIKDLFNKLLIARKTNPFIVSLKEIELSKDSEAGMVRPYITLVYTTLDIHIEHKFIGGMCHDNPYAIAQHIFDECNADYEHNIGAVLKFYIEQCSNKQ